MEAIDEFDELGRDEFLQKYGFGKAKAYFLEHDGKLYDSKAIVGAAHGYSRVDMEPLTSDELHGGKSAHPVIPFLENLGFKVTNSPPPSPTSPKADKEKVEKLVAVLKQHAGQRLSASDLKRETGVAKHRIRTLLRESPLGVDVEISPKPPYRFWWGETVEEFPLRLFSWEVLSRRVAKKKLDRSAFLHHGTGLPAAITWFFGISERGPRFREVCLVFNGETFDARIPADNQGRYRLFWGKDFASTLGRAFPDSLSAHQKKLKSNHDVWMQLKKLSAESYEVEFFPKLAGGSLTSTSRPPSPTTPEGGKEKTQKWTTDELRLVIEGYLEMSRRFQGGEKVVKRRYYADLASNIERTESSIERRMQNISHVFNLQGRRWIPGLVPLEHVGVKVIEQIEILLAEQEGLPNQGGATFIAKVAAARKRGVGEKPKGNKTPRVMTGSSSSYERDHEVVAHVLNLAKGRCEFCGELGPFEKSIDKRYLEVHHVRRLADGGPDIVENAVALCPNCHRGFHHARDRMDRTEELYEKVKRLQP